MEAMFQSHGYAGLAEGLYVVLEICRRYWKDMYPAVENGDMEGRISPIVWINEKLAYQLKLEPLSDPKSTDHIPCNFSDWERANMMENLAARDNAKFQEMEAKGEITRSKFLGSVMFTPRGFYVALLEEIRRTRQLTLELGEFYDQVCGKDAPSLHSFRDILGEIRRLVENFLKEKEPERAFEADEGSNKDTAFLDDDSAPDSQKGKRVAFLSIRNRSEAYRMLSEAADYLLIHEPHSPTPYLVKRAVSWGHMTLTELLEELIGDEQKSGADHETAGAFQAPGMRTQRS